MALSPHPRTTVHGHCRLAVAVQGLDHLDGLEVDYEGLWLADGSIAAWAEHDETVLGISVMPDGGGILMASYPNLEEARRAARRARAFRESWEQSA